MKLPVGLKVTAVPRYCKVQNGYGIKKKRSMIYFECKVDKKNKIILGEGQRFKCFPFNKIKKLKIVPMDYVAIHSHYYNSRNYTSFYR